MYSEWNRVTTRRLTRRRLTRLALAASFFVVIGSLAVFIRPELFVGEADPVARVQRVDDERQVAVTRRGSSPMPLLAGTTLLAGNSITTGDGQASFDFIDGGSVRLATQTEIELLSDSEVELIRGALYFDSINMTPDVERFLLYTSVGLVRHVGTQFAARQAQGAVEVSVREGEIAVHRGREQIVVATGERVQVPVDGGRIERQTIPLIGEHWHWADRMLPVFEIDGANLFDYLNWMARETGHRLVFETEQAEQAARTTILHGSIDMEPLPMLSAVMATTDLEYRILEGTLYISLP
ncbi:MAG: hypothetical protein F4181_08320 [Proteobacteria bacterium]|nr:hypothetical protein [Pseudomonadota bacterium]